MLMTLLERIGWSSFTAWHLLHENLDEAILAERAQVLHNVAMLQSLVQGDLFVERLRVTGKHK